MLSVCVCVMCICIMSSIKLAPIVWAYCTGDRCIYTEWLKFYMIQYKKTFAVHSIQLDQVRT